MFLNLIKFTLFVLSIYFLLKLILYSYNHTINKFKIKVKVYNGLSEKKTKEIVDSNRTKNTINMQILTFKKEDESLFTYKDYEDVLNLHTQNMNVDFGSVLKDLNSLESPLINETDKPYVILTDSKNPNFTSNYVVIMSSWVKQNWRIFKVTQIIKYEYHPDQTKDEYMQQRAKELFFKMFGKVLEIEQKPQSK